MPQQTGRPAACRLVVGIGPVPLVDLVAHTVPVAEPCKEGCGAAVGVSDMILDWQDEFFLREMNLPGGLWEPPHPALSSDGDPVHAVVFHDGNRCRELRSAHDGTLPVGQRLTHHRLDGTEGNL